MKKLLVVMVFCCLMAGNALSGEMLVCDNCQGGFVFNGYGPEEFGLTSELFKKMDDTITKIQSVNPANNQTPVDAILIFDIAGSASVDGERAKNDKYGLLRADQVEAYLSGKFPNAKFHSYSTGPEFNSRQVELKWKFVKATTEIKKQITPLVQPEAKPEEKKYFVLNEAVVLDGILVLIVLVLIAGINLYFNQRSRKREAEQDARKISEQKMLAEESWPSELKDIAKMYIEKKNGDQLKKCAFCGAEVSGKKYVAHLRKCAWSPLIGLDNEGAVIELQKYYNQTKS